MLTVACSQHEVVEIVKILEFKCIKINLVCCFMTKAYTIEHMQCGKKSAPAKPIGSRDLNTMIHNIISTILFTVSIRFS